MAGKFGLSAYATPKTVVRATAYSRLTPAIGRLQTLEPTQVSGFNQFFERSGVARRRSTTASASIRSSRETFFAGFSVLRRDLGDSRTVVRRSARRLRVLLHTPSRLHQQADRHKHRDSGTATTGLGSVYLSGTAGRRVSLGLQYSYEERELRLHPGRPDQRGIRRLRADPSSATGGAGLSAVRPVRCLSGARTTTRKSDKVDEYAGI